nr:hypothetical protein CR513_50743 [Ipomoea batatas]
MRRQLQVAGLHEVWHAAYSQPDHVHATVPSPAYWFPLAVNQLKCNVDAAIFENGASYGVVVRDHNGRFVDACGRRLGLVRDLAFRDGVLCQFTGKNQSDGGLDLAGSNGRLLVVAGQSRCLLGELLEDIVDEAVHDAHGLARDPDIRMDLLQNLEDVDLNKEIEIFTENLE